MSTIEGNPPPKELPKIWGDFNARGLSGQKNDDCIYSLHRKELTKLIELQVTLAFVYEDDEDEIGNPEVFGFVCELQKIDGFISPWRAKPIKGTWYRGPKTW